MSNPPVPSFPNSEKHVSQKELSKEIRIILVALANKMPTSEQKNKIFGFVNCINPDSCKDPARIPYDRETAKHNDKIECLCAKIYQLLKTYWQFCEDGIGIETLKGKIAEIKKITQCGLQNCKTEGDDKVEYQLV
jgi:hypothetical protein